MKITAIEDKSSKNKTLTPSCQFGQAFTSRPEILAIRPANRVSKVKCPLGEPLPHSKSCSSQSFLGLFSGEGQHEILFSLHPYSRMVPLDTIRGLRDSGCRGFFVAGALGSRWRALMTLP
jgi:hypothetical protein